MLGLLVFLAAASALVWPSSSKAQSDDLGAIAMSACTTPSPSPPGSPFVRGGHVVPRSVDLKMPPVVLAHPNRIYATVANPRTVGIYRSDDAGESWTRITIDPRPAARIGGGDLPVPAVDPKNPGTVIIASTVSYRSKDGGKTWSRCAARLAATTISERGSTRTTRTSSRWRAIRARL